MKKLILTLIIITSLNLATITNDGATVTIGEGVTLRSDGDFINNGTLVNNGTFAISGSVSGNFGSDALNGTNITYFGDAEVDGNIDYNTLTIEGNNYLSLSQVINVYENLVVLGNFNISANINLGGNFIRENGGDVTGDGWIIGYHLNGSADMYNIKNLGFIVDYPNDLSATVHRHSGMVDNNERMSLNGYFETNLNLEPDTHELLNIGIALDEQDLNGMDLEKISIFHSTDLTNWKAIGGDVNDGYIMLNEIPYELFQDDNNLSLNGYYTVGQVGCTAAGAANYDVMAFHGEYECSYNYAETFSSGYSLISFYSIDDEDNSIDNVMTSLDMSLNLISEGSASTVHPILGWVGSINDVDRDKGYWLYLFESDTYELDNGKPTRTDLTYYLNSGNNLISYSGPSNTPIGDAISVESSCKSIIGSGVAATYINGIGWIGSLSDLKPWNGYWFNCAEAEDFQFEGHGALPRPVVPIEIPEFLSFEQSPRQAFYFIESIEGAEVGRDFIISKKGDDILGVVPYGEYAAVPAMGVFEHVAGYETGEHISLELYNSDEELYYYLNGQYLAPWNDLDINIVGPMTMTPVVPEGYKLHNAYPNPFNPVSNIQFDLPEDTFTELSVYDMTGRMVETLITGNLDAGYYNITWDASGKASGMYLLKLHAGDFIETQKITLLK